MTRALSMLLLLGCATDAPGWRVERVSGPVAAYCTAEPGPCQDTCRDRVSCTCTCWVDGLTDMRTRTIVLSESPHADAREVEAHEWCHAGGGTERQCR
jgi:hypothetical protein